MRRSVRCVRACAMIAGGVLLVAAGRTAFAEEPGELLKSVEQSQAVVADAIRRDVQVQLEDARNLMASDPAAVIASLKRLADVVAASPDLSASERAALSGQISQTLQEASRREVSREAIEQERLAAHAAARERQHAVAAMESRHSRLEQLVDRLASLLDEGRYELAEEVAATAAEQAPVDSPLAASLPNNTRTAKYVHDAAATRVARQQGVVATLQRAEVAHVPQSDEPPIVYIDAEKWQELTLRRGKYSTDMYQETPAEAKIRNALEEITALEFVETPLGDVIDFLKDRHGIEIQLDTRSLDEIGTGSDTPVTIQMNGITLRSALRLLLRQLDLTYTIKDEVLFITTPETAATMIVPHVHKVGDIVLPIANFGFSGGFGGLGGGNSNGMFGAGQGQNGQGQNGQNPFNNNNQNANPFGQQNGNNLF